jgi:hypothetical protein
MAEREQPGRKPVESQGYWEYWRADLIGCLSFVVTLAACLAATVLATHLATRDIGRTEVSDALGHAMVWTQWCCGGSFVSLIVAGVVACAAARRADKAGGQPPPP